jgi:dUTP pyrophosphatase
MRICKRTKEPITIPTRKHRTDAGIDLYAVGEYVIPPNKVAVIHTGVSVEIPSDCMGFITNKSRSNFLVGAGVIDEGYQGELLVKIFNVLDSELIIKNGDPVAQLIIVKILKPDLEWVTEEEFLSNITERHQEGGIWASTTK